MKWHKKGIKIYLPFLNRLFHLPFPLLPISHVLALAPALSLSPLTLPIGKN